MGPEMDAVSHYVHKLSDVEEEIFELQANAETRLQKTSGRQSSPFDVAFVVDRRWTDLYFCAQSVS